MIQNCKAFVHYCERRSKELNTQLTVMLSPKEGIITDSSWGELHPWRTFTVRQDGKLVIPKTGKLLTSKDAIKIVDEHKLELQIFD